MTIEEFNKVINNDAAVREEYLNAEREGKVDGFIRKYHLDATTETLKELYKEKNKYNLDDSELEKVAGGTGANFLSGKGPTVDTQPIDNSQNNSWL